MLIWKHPWASVFKNVGVEGASVFTKWASAEPKTPFLEGVKRNQLPLLKF